MSKEAIALMRKAIAMMEGSGGEGEMSSMPVQEIESRMSPMPNDDGSSSSLGNSETGGEENDFDSRKNKKAVVLAAMKKKGY